MLWQRAWLSSPEQGMEPVVRQPTSSCPRACVDSPHVWGRCMWWIASWPVPMGVAEKNRAPCFPCWRHDFRAPLQPSAVNVYTACSSSGRPLVLTHRAGGQHPLTKHLACAPRGRITKKWTNHIPVPEVNYRFGLRRNFKIPEFLLPLWVGIFWFHLSSRQWEDISDNVSNATNTVWRVREADIRPFDQSLSFLLN